MLNYLFCLSELQETRLGTPAETLAQILLGSDELDNPLSAKVLVNTWIYDEGDVENVLELCRDIYLITNCQDVSLWCKLFTRMFDNRQFHILVSSVAMIAKYPFWVEDNYSLKCNLFEGLCNSVDMLPVLLIAITTILEELISTIQQVTIIALILCSYCI